MLTIQTVHTTGINVESLVVIIGSIVATVGIVGGWIAKRIDKTRAQTTKEITNSVDHLGEVLTERLETKVAVANLRSELYELRGEFESAMRIGTAQQQLRQQQG